MGSSDGTLSARDSSVIRSHLVPDREDGVLEHPAGRQRDRDRLALLAADDSLADGRLVADLHVAGIGLRRADHLVDVYLAALSVLEFDLAAERDLVVLLGRADDRGVRQDLVDLDDPALDPRLLVLGVVVLGVLRDVAELLGFLDALADFAALRRRQVEQLVLKLLLAFDGECDLLVHVCVTPIAPVLPQNRSGASCAPLPSNARAAGLARRPLRSFARV